MQSFYQTRYVILLLAGLQAFGPLSIDLILPALPNITHELATSHTNSQLSVGVFLAGLFIGMLFYGPLSDRFGRRRLLLAGITIYVIASLFCMLAQSVEQLLVGRFLQAIGAAAASVLGRTIIRDIFSLDRAARALSLMHLVTMVAAMLAPLLGSYLLLLGSWRILFLVLTVFSTLLLLLSYWKLTETLPQHARHNSISAVFQSYQRIIRNRQAMALMLCSAFCFAGMFAYITLSAFVFIEHFSRSPQFYAWLFFSNICGISALVLFNAHWVERLGVARMLRLCSRLCLIASLMLISVSLLNPNGMWWIIAGLFAYISCTGVVSTNSLAMLMDYYPNNAGAAAGLAIALQFGLSAIISMLIGIIADGTPAYMTWTVGLCGLAAFGAMQASTRMTAPATN